MPWQIQTILAYKATGRARHSVRAVVCLAEPGAHGVTRATFMPPNAQSLFALTQAKYLSRISVNNVHGDMESSLCGCWR